MPKGPDQQGGAEGQEADTDPSRPGRQVQRRPGQPRRIDEEGKDAQPEHEAQQSQRDEDKQAFLPPVEFLASRLRLQSVESRDWKYHDEGGEEDETEGVIRAHGKT